MPMVGTEFSHVANRGRAARKNVSKRGVSMSKNKRQIARLLLNCAGTDKFPVVYKLYAHKFNKTCGHSKRTTFDPQAKLHGSVRRNGV